MLAQVVLNRVRATLIDAGDVAWPASEKLDYLNQALTAVTMLKADSYNVTIAIPLVAGAQQALPTDAANPTYPTGHTLIDIIANDSSVGGQAAMEVSRESLTAANRTWMTQTGTLQFDEWMFDKRAPRTFWVNPPNNGSGKALVTYGAIHPRLTAETGNPAGTILLPDSYESALWAHVLSACYAKNTKRQDLVKATSYMQMFVALMGSRTSSRNMNAPAHQTLEGTDGAH